MYEYFSSRNWLYLQIIGYIALPNSNLLSKFSGYGPEELVS